MIFKSFWGLILGVILLHLGFFALCFGVKLLVMGHF